MWAKSAAGAQDRLRLSAYPAAPRQRVLRPWAVSSLFGHLPRRSRPAFRAGLILVVGASVAFALLGWKVPTVVTAVLGLPVLYAVYLGGIARSRAIPVRHLVPAAVVAVGLGVAWQLVTGPLVEDAYYAEMGGQLTGEQLLVCGVIVPITFGLVLIAPAVLVRVLSRTDRESLDGFAIGAAGATFVNAAATATYLMPQLESGLTGAPAESLLVEAMVEGVAWPLGSVAAGGMVGLALWFRPRVGVPVRCRRAVVLPAAVFGAVAFAVAMGFVDVAAIPMGAYLGLQVPIALGALLAVRTAVSAALLHEDPGPAGAGPRRCPECGQLVAPMPFCSDCGLALRATAPRVVSYRDVTVPVTAGVGAVVAAAVAVAVFLTPAPAAYVCPPDCGRPPFGSPVETNPRFSGDDGVFSVSYPGEGTAYEVTFDPPGMTGVQARYVGGDTGLLNLFGEPARDRTPKQVAEDTLKAKFPGATVDYEIPNASVGYEPGYGVVADLYLRDSRLRVIVMAAVRHDYALVATAAGPYHEFSPDYGTGHPSGANLEVAMDMGKYVNSFRWNADRYQRSS